MDAQTNSFIQERVMARIRFIHQAKMLVAGPLLALALFAVSLWGIGREVWVARVFQNMPSLADVAGVSRFFLDAFMHTDIVVQALCLLAAVAFLWMVRNAAHMVVRPMRLA